MGLNLVFHDAFPTEPYYSIGEACWNEAENNAFQRQEAVCNKYAVELDTLSEENRRLRERELRGLYGN